MKESNWTGASWGKADCNFCQFSLHHTPSTLLSIEHRISQQLVTDEKDRTELAFLNRCVNKLLPVA